MQSITPITTDDFKAKSNIVIGKIEIDSDGAGTYIILPDIKDISITTNIQNVVSRLCSYTFSITCLNTDDQFSPFKGSSPYYRKLKRGRKLKIYMGIKKAEVEYYWQWQICIIDDIKLNESAGEKFCTITGRDLMGLLLDYKLYYPNTFWGKTIYFSTEDGKTIYYLPNGHTFGAWVIEGAYYSGLKNPSDEDSQPQGMAFSSDGTKMYLIGAVNDTIFQYSLSTPWDIMTAIYNNKNKNVSAQCAAPRDIFIESDGIKMYVLDYGTPGIIFQYLLSTPWDISTASYDNKSKNIYDKEVYPYSIDFSSDGTKMYLIGTQYDTVFQYTLTTSWDISTAVYSGKYKNVNSEEGAPYGLFFRTDGLKMYIVGYGGGKVFEYSLTVAWDVSTASYNGIFKNISTEDDIPLCILFNSDGKKMYIVGGRHHKIYQYLLDDESIVAASGVYEASVDDIEPRNGEDEEDFSLLIEGTDFIYNKWENTITFSGSGGAI